MVQTVCTLSIPQGKKMIVIEKPRILNRIFFSIATVLSATSGYDIQLSFDDPIFRSYYSLRGSKKYFEAEGVDIFQGNIWVYNKSSADVEATTTEILH